MVGLTRYVCQVRNASIKPKPKPQGPVHSGPRVPVFGKRKEARASHQSLLMAATDLLSTFMLSFRMKSDSMLFGVGLFTHFMTDEVFTQ